MNTTIEYTIAEHYLSYLINGDDSGLEFNELSQLVNFLIFENIQGWERSINSEDEGQFAQCDVCGLYANCYTVTFFRVARVWG